MARQRVQATDATDPDQLKAQVAALNWGAGPFDVVISGDGDRIVLDDETEPEQTQTMLDTLDYTGGIDVTVQLNDP